LLLTVTETARALKLERFKVYILIEENIVEAFRLGRHWRIRASSVARLLGASTEGRKFETTFEVTDGNKTQYPSVMCSHHEHKSTRPSERFLTHVETL